MALSSRDSVQPDNSALSDRVVMAVAAACDADPIELPPLYDVIDPDALDRLFRHGGAAGRNGFDRVIFQMADCEVVVNGTGEIEVTHTERSPASSTADRADGQDEAETTLG